MWVLVYCMVLFSRIGVVGVFVILVVGVGGGVSGVDGRLSCW